METESFEYFGIEDMRYYADKHRGKNKLSGPHWPLVYRFPILFDEFEKQAVRIEKLEDALQRIVDWANAYPEDIFIPPTKDELQRANKILAEHGISFSAINGATMKHVVDGVGNIAREALGE